MCTVLVSTVVRVYVLEILGREREYAGGQRWGPRVDEKTKGPAVAVITAAGAKVNSMKSFMCTHTLAPFVPIHILL